MIDLRKQPLLPHTYTSRYGIGDTVWHAKGVYQIPISFRILSVKFQFDAYGSLLTFYAYVSGQSSYWHEESELFPTEQDCYNSL